MRSVERNGFRDRCRCARTDAPARSARRVGWVVITAEMCVSGRDLTEPRPSPDGSVVAFVVRWGGSTGIVTVPIGGGPERLVTTLPPPSPGRGLGGGCFAWLPDGSAVVYASGGGLWVQPVGAPGPEGPGATRVVHHGDDASVRAPSVSPDGAHVAYTVDEAQVWLAAIDGHDLPRRLDDGSADFCVDPHVGAGPDDGLEVRWQAWSVPHMPWDAAHVETARVGTDGEVIAREQRRSTGAIQQPRTLPGGDGHGDGRHLEVRDDTGWLNVWLDDEPVVDEPFEHAGPTWGPGQRSYAPSPDVSRLAFTRNEEGFGRLCVVDLREERDRAVTDVARGVHGQLGWAGDHLVALRTGARTPTSVVAYDTTTVPWQRRILAVGPVAGWDSLGDRLPEPEPVRIVAGGATLHARRYVAGNGRLICWIHGGPTDQWQVEFMPRVAYWVAQGWDVLAVDPRGSTGHGRSYQQALHGGWGRVDVDDTATAIAHAHHHGWSDPSTTVVIGGSSGGLTTLGVLGLHPGLAAGGVVSYPVCDLGDLAERSHRFEAHYTLSLVGPLDEVELYRERSPLSYADRIGVPLLVMHGDADPVVPVEQSIRLADLVRSAGGDVELHVFAGEGHGFRDPANKLAEYELVGRFLGRVVPTSLGPAPG